MKIHFLMFSTEAQAGTAVATRSLAESLAAEHEVTLVGVFRCLQRSVLPFDESIELRSLVDIRLGSKDRTDPLHRKKSKHWYKLHDDAKRYTALVDQRVKEYLDTTDADAVIATAPPTVSMLGAMGSDRYFKIGQAHTHFHHQPEAARKYLDKAIPELDAFVSVTDRDRRTHADRYGECGPRFAAIANAVSPTDLRGDPERSKVVTAAARFVHWKNLDLAVRAFGKASEGRPDWEMRIFGDGEDLPKIRDLIKRLGVGDRVRLMGQSHRLREELAEAAIHTSTSTDETFGLTIVEAMSCGVPVLSTAGPHGPSEIITSGENGVLSPVGDIDAFAENLRKLMDDPALRRRLGERGLERAGHYLPEHQLERYEALFADLERRRDRRAYADCLVGDGGDLTATFLPGSLGEGTAVLRCERIGADGAEARTFPVVRSDDGGGRAVIPASEPLESGRWKVGVADEADGRVYPVVARTIRQRTDSSLEPLPDRTLLARFRNYCRARNRQLVVNSRESRDHAEVDHAVIEGTLLKLDVRGVGGIGHAFDEGGESAAVIARDPSGKANDLVFTPRPGDAGGFDIDLQAFADAWDGEKRRELYLRVPGCEPTRIGRFGDDIPRRGGIDVFPRLRLSNASGVEVPVHCKYDDENRMFAAISAKRPKPKRKRPLHQRAGSFAKRALGKVRRTLNDARIRSAAS